MEKIHIVEHTVLKSSQSIAQFVMPIEYSTCTGIMIVSETLGYTTLEMLVDSKEVFPKNFDARLIRFTEQNSRNNVTWPLKEAVSNKTIKLTFSPKGMTADELVRIYFFVQ